jgi:hypothetical protein
MAEISVLLVAGPLRARLVRTLEALARQSRPERMEVVIADLAPEAGGLQLPEPLRSVVHPAPGLSYAEARVLVLNESSAACVAFLEDHVVPSPGWLDATLAAFEGNAGVVNFSFANWNPETNTSRGCMLLAYGHWLAPMPPGPAGFVACHNIAYRRQALAPFQENLAAWFETEFYLHDRMRELGTVFRQAGGAVLAHENWTRLADACRDSGAFQQLFGSQRAALGGWSRSRRAFYAAAMVVCPPLHTWRLARRLLGRGRLFLEFLAAVPVILVVYTYGAWREAIGYLCGIQNSRHELTEVEFRLERG